MDEYYSNYEIAQMISARIGNEPIPFDSVYSICLLIYKELGGTEQDFDSIYEILLAILPLTDRIADKIIDDSIIVTNKTWSSYKINAELANAGFDVSIVQELPASGDIHTIYFVTATDGETPDVYDEYMYIDSSFEKIGSTRLDLTDYYTKSETNTLLSEKQDNLTAGTNITISGNTISATVANYSAGTNIDISNNIISAKGYVYNSSTGSFALNYKNAHLTELNTASGENSYAEGEHTTASGIASHTEGGYTTASGDYSHAEGVNSIASGDDSHAEGNATASGDLAHAEGFVTQAKGYTSHTEGFSTVANNYYEHAQGSNNISHTVVDGYDYVDLSTHLKTIHSIGIGIGNEHKNAEEIMLNGDMYIYGVNYDGVHIKGQTGAPANTQTLQEVINSKQDTLTAGDNITISNGVISATGGGTIYTAGSNISISLNTISAKGYVYDETNRSFAEGYGNTASGFASHAEGYNTTASGNYSHAEGSETKATGLYSHAEGCDTSAIGFYSHAEGINTVASGYYSHAEGLGTIASHIAEHTQGTYNISNSRTISSIGIGISDSDRKNAVEVMNDGKVYIKDVGNYDGTNPAQSQTLQTVINGKQDTLTAGANITISGNTISATDTTYTAGDNITISNGVISATDTTYTAGNNITISNGVISATNTTYTAGLGIIINPLRNNQINVVEATDEDIYALFEDIEDTPIKPPINDDMHSTEYWEGYDAGYDDYDNDTITTNPYTLIGNVNRVKAADWNEGYSQGYSDAENGLSNQNPSTQL